MNRPSKEVVLAVSLGIILGVVVAYGAWRANQALKQSGVVTPEADSISKAEEDGVFAMPTPVNELIIIEPTAEALVDEESITISGQSPRESIIVIMAEDQELITKTDYEGGFSMIVDLTKGVNLINITAIESSGQTQEKDLMVVYSEAEI